MKYPVGVLRGFAICIDAGHGGEDPGAVDGKAGTDKLNTLEKDINLKVCLLLQSNLAKLGARVTLTRGADTYPTLQRRYSMANEFGADIFVSVHCNAGPAAAKGIETLYNPYRIGGKRLADLIQHELIIATKANDRGIKSRDDLAVLNGTKMPAVLVELGFISNEKEEINLNNATYQSKLIDALVNGIVRFKTGK